MMAGERQSEASGRSDRTGWIILGIVAGIGLAILVIPSLLAIVSVLFGAVIWLITGFFGAIFGLFAFFFGLIWTLLPYLLLVGLGYAIAWYVLTRRDREQL